MFLIVIGILLPLTLIEDSLAESFSPRQQWEKFADPDLLKCKEGLILLQKNNGYPACVTPSTYLKLIERNFTKFDFTLILDRSNMMNYLIQNMAYDTNMINHWHDMMLKNPNAINTMMVDWVQKMKEDSTYLKNVIGPMASEPQLREKMISLMKKHPVMEEYLKNNSDWMHSVHQNTYAMDKDMHMDMCTWCPDYEHSLSTMHSMSHEPTMHSMSPESDKMTELIHRIWINNKLNHDMNQLMLENPTHMAMMSEIMMNDMLFPIMDDPQLRENMAELLLEHQAFMNSIRHS